MTPTLSRQLHGKSVHKGDRLSRSEAEYVDDLCRAAYREARELRTIGTEHVR